MQILALQELYTGPTSRPLDVDAGHRLDVSSQCRGTVIHRRSSIHREVAIVERMILDLHREPPVVGIERWSLGDRPGLEHAVELKPEVVMQPPRATILLSPLGSAVLEKSRLARYFESLPWSSMRFSAR
jgi:hypothetical protein